jgi:hypothetical protein
MSMPLDTASPKPRRCYKRNPQRRLRYSRAGIPQPDDVDGRSRHAKRFRKLSDELAAEVGRPLSAIERTVVEQAVRLLLRSQTETNVGAAIRLASESRRLLASLRDKSQHKTTPNGQDALARHLAERYGPAAAVADDDLGLEAVTP